MNIYQSPLCSCIICKEEYSFKGIETHYLRKHTNKSLRDTGRGTQKFQLRCSCVQCKQEVSVQNIDAHVKTHDKPTNDCLCCGNSTYNKFCTKSCAAKYNNSTRDYTKFKPGPKKGSTPKIKKIRPKKLYFCQVCEIPIVANRKACSDTCRSELFRIAGKKSASTRILRSKDEIKLYELCLEEFAHVTHNEPIFNGWDADILIYDTKTAVLWNGPWHYKQLTIKNHSLKQVQNRDQIKQKEIESAGWTCIVFEDRYYTPESAFKALSSDPQS